MSYTKPALGNIDLTGSSGGYAPPPLGNIDISGGATPTSDPAGTISANLSFTAIFSGFMQPVGTISAALPFTADFFGGDSVWGVVSAGLGFSAEISGQTASIFGAIDSGLDFLFSVRGFQDWTDNLPTNLLQTFYTLTITGTPDLVVPISSWQATLRMGSRSDYLQAVIPAAQDLAESISDRSSGRLLIKKGYIFDDGSKRSEVIAESEFSAISSARGPVNYTITVSGYMASKTADLADRQIKNARSINVANGSYRVRSDIDLFLRPGMNAGVLGGTFKVDYINFYVSVADQFCEVGGE